MNDVPQHATPKKTSSDGAALCYLVTGAAGFIAAKVCEQLLADGHTVVGVDNLNDYYDVRLKDYRLSRLLGDTNWQPGADPKASIYGATGKGVGATRWPQRTTGTLIPGTSSSEIRDPGITLQPRTKGCFTFHHLDIEDLDSLSALFATHKFDAVFNLAARAGVRYSIAHPHVYLSTNTLGMINLLECQRKYGVRKQVLASTSSLYAGCKMPFTEDQPVNRPLSPYAATKKAAELMAYSYHHLYGLDISVARYFTVFGPAGRPDMSVFRFIKWIDEGTPIELHGDGTQSRDFTYVDDIARGTILAAKPLGYEIINLGGGRNPINLNTVISHLENMLGKKAAILDKPFHAADLMETWADISKASRLLSWQPQITAEEGFHRCVQWHTANRKWLHRAIV
jgi:nucleoside-diphosphate-sugar epimerase